MRIYGATYFAGQEIVESRTSRVKTEASLLEGYEACYDAQSNYFGTQ